jgi:hypothetical protein
MLQNSSWLYKETEKNASQASRTSFQVGEEVGRTLLVACEA